MRNALSTETQDSRSPVAFMAAARDIEHRRYQLTALLESLRNARCEAENRETDLDRQRENLRQQARQLQDRIDKVQVEPQEVIPTACVIAVTSLVLIGLFSEFPGLDLLLAVISLGNTEILLIEVVVVFPLVLAYLYRSDQADQETESRKNALRAQKAGVDDAERDVRRKEETIARMVLPYYDLLIGECETALRKLAPQRAQVYACGSLHRDYRDFIATATMLSYLESRRCLTIEGHGGAIDTYEGDRRLDCIIDNLQGLRHQVAFLGGFGPGIAPCQRSVAKDVQQADNLVDSIVASVKEACTHMEHASSNARSKALPAARKVSHYCQRALR